jgi:hypothetical protein
MNQERTLTETSLTVCGHRAVYSTAMRLEFALTRERIHG